MAWLYSSATNNQSRASMSRYLGSWNRKGGFYIPEGVPLPAYALRDYAEPKYRTGDAYPGKWPFASQGVTNGVIDASIGDDAFFKGWFVYATNLTNKPFCVCTSDEGLL